MSDLKIDLKNLTKEELITVIANMHDTIQKWNDGYGLPKKESDVLDEVGSQCCAQCSTTNSWSLEKIGN